MARAPWSRLADQPAEGAGPQPLSVRHARTAAGGAGPQPACHGGGTGRDRRTVARATSREHGHRRRVPGRGGRSYPDPRPEEHSHVLRSRQPATDRADRRRGARPRAVVLTTADGQQIGAFRARANAPTGAGIIILPDVRGLHPYYEELALRFAEAGVDAVAIDYFGRTAGTGDRDADFDYRSHVGQMTWDGTLADIRAGAAAVREGGRVVALFAIGFCMGGRLAFLTPTIDLGMSGAIGFYGWPTGSRPSSPAPVDVAAEMRAPILGIFGGRRRGDHARRRRRVRARPGRRRGGPRARHLPRRAAQLLRPQGGRLRRGVDERLAPDAEVHPGEHAGRVSRSTELGTRRRRPRRRCLRLAGAGRHRPTAGRCRRSSRAAGGPTGRRCTSTPATSTGGRSTRSGRTPGARRAGSGCGSPAEPDATELVAFAWYGPPTDADLVVAPDHRTAGLARSHGRLGRGPGRTVRCGPRPGGSADSTSTRVESTGRSGAAVPRAAGPDLDRRAPIPDRRGSLRALGLSRGLRAGLRPPLRPDRATST